MRNEEYEFQNTYEKTVKLCTVTDTTIPTPKKTKNVIKSKYFSYQPVHF